MVITMQRYHLGEILKAVREKEKEGFECVIPITKVAKSQKKWKYSTYYERYIDFDHVDEYEVYVVKMRKDEHSS